MLSFLSNIVRGVGQTRHYRSQINLLNTQADSALSTATRNASNLMRTAEANRSLESDKRKTTRQNQTAATQAARNAQASSGFTAQGTASTAEHITHQSYDEAIANMARSASIDYLNYFQTAQATKAQGRLQKSALLSQARQYDTAADATSFSTGLSAISGLVGAGLGAVSGYNSAQNFNAKNAAAIANGDLNAASPLMLATLRGSSFAGDFSSLPLTFNPFTASLTKNNNWGSFSALVAGNTPGFEYSDFSL